MDKLLTVSFETRENDIESAVAALTAAGIHAQRTILADKNRTLVSAGFKFEGARPSMTDWDDASEKAIAIFDAAGVEAKAVGQGVSSAESFN